QKITGELIPKYQAAVYFMTFHHTSWILFIGYLEGHRRYMYKPLTRESNIMHLISQWCRSRLQMMFILMAYGILMCRRQLLLIHAKLLVIREASDLVFFV